MKGWTVNGPHEVQYTNVNITISAYPMQKIIKTPV